MAAQASHCAAFDEYPSTFTPELIRHCRASGLPPALFADLRTIAASRPRYVRLHPRLVERWGTIDVDQLARQLGSALNLSSDDVPQHVSWLPCWCFAVPRTCPLRGFPLFDEGLLAAMDAASMAVVVALGPRVGDRVLDLCCSPGMKLNLLADACTPNGEDISDSHGDSDDAIRSETDSSSSAREMGYVLGVDISVERLFTARAQVVKHNMKNGTPRVCLVAADGQTVTIKRVATGAFDTHERARVSASTGLTAAEKRRLRQRRKRSLDDTTAASTVEEDANCTGANGLTEQDEDQPAVVYAPPEVRRLIVAHAGSGDGRFDRVLVDAECTHDGSLAHLDLDPANTVSPTEGLSNAYRMEKMNLWSSVGKCRDKQEAPVHTIDTLEMGYASTPCDSPPDKHLAELQLRLLLHGYRQLRPGGTLVYSTCSFSFWQNEFIVHRFLHLVRENAHSNVFREGAAEGPEQDDDSIDDTNTEPVVIKPLCFDYEPGNRKAVAAALTPNAGCAFAALQRRLDEVSDRYGIVSAGSTATGVEAAEVRLGSRFWPCDMQTSFQYVVKIWKRVRSGERGDCTPRATSASLD